ncbi:MAG: hypothetical protein K6G07_01185 [Lachnospiraceae bacterium]|nr:hypothetical protein [Lachnospiraceae bacterium]
MDKNRYDSVEKGIYRNKATGKYTVSIYLGRTESGKKRSTKTFNTLRDARNCLAEYRVSRANDEIELLEEDKTIDDLMDDFRKMYIDINTEKTTSQGYAFIEKRI